MRTLPLVVMICACSGTTDRATVSFVAEANTLALEHSPINEGYHASYPNPKHHDWMKVEVRNDGRVTTACRTEQLTECGDSPVNVTVDEGRVRVFDVYGQKLADMEYVPRRCGATLTPTTPTATPTEGPGGSGTPPPSNGGSEPTLTETAASDPQHVSLALEDPGDVGSMDPADSDDDDGEAHGGACPSGGGGTTPQTSCPALEAKSAFCAGLNEGLTKYNLPAYDCGHLELNQTFEQPTLDGDVHCKRQVVTPAGDTVRHAYPGCRTLVRTWENNSLAEIRDTGLCGGSPLVLDLDGDGIHSSSVEQGVRFDLFASGERPKLAWLGGGDGLLVLDRNGNGLVDDGSELFGQANAADGFQALARLDANGDGRVDALDPEFTELRVWVDVNRDGIGPASEWKTLAQVGIVSLGVRPRRVVASGVADPNGNWLPLRSQFERSDGTLGQLVDVWFQFRH